MAATRTADIRALLGGGGDENRLVAAHFVVGALFLAAGGALELLALFTLRFGGLAPLSYGRLEAMANLAVMVGFLVVTLTGGVYYVLPRLTGVRLWRADLAMAGLLATSTVVVIGLVAIPLGWTSGRRPFGLPWWLHLPLAVAILVPLLVTLGTIREREEKRSFVTLWYLLAGVAWLPLLFLAYLYGELPVVGALGEAYADLFLTAGFVNLWVFVVGSGLFYYTLVKEVDVPLASRPLASVGLWSLGLSGAWWGTAQLIFGPGPGWVDGVAAALGLAFPLGALANASNYSMSLHGRWQGLGDKPGVVSGVIGAFFGVAVAVLASLASFRTVGGVVALTPYWEAIEYAALFGVGALLAAGVAFEALPRVAGRELRSGERPRSFNRLTVIGVGGVLVTLTTSGLLTGYSWIAGSNSAAFVEVGEGWGAGAGAGEALLLVALAFAAVAFLGQLAYTATVVGTITSGRPVPQEVLVGDGADSEATEPVSVGAESDE